MTHTDADFDLNDQSGSAAARLLLCLRLSHLSWC